MPLPAVTVGIALAAMIAVPACACQEEIVASNRPGPVAQITYHEATQITSAWLANGVRVNHRFLKLPDDQVFCTVTFAGGELLESSENRGISRAAAVGLLGAETPDHPRDEIINRLREARAAVSVTSSPDAISITFYAPEPAFGDAIAVISEILRTPVISEDAIRNWRSETVELALARRTRTEDALSEAVTDAIYPPGDARQRPVPAEQADRITADAAQAWLREHIAVAPMEIAVVGPVERTRAISLVAGHFGALPRRARIGDQTYADRRRLPLPREAITVRTSIDAHAQDAAVFFGFFGADHAATSDRRALLLAARILSGRAVRAVELEGKLAQRVQVLPVAGIEYPGFGLVYAAAATSPARADEVVNRLRALFDEFAQRGPTEEDMAVARLRTAQNFRAQLEDGSFWMSQLATLAYRGGRADDIAGAQAMYMNFTAEEVRSVFSRFYRPEVTVTVVVTSEAPPRP